MAERSQFFDTTGTGDGTGSGYTEDNVRQQHSRMMTTTLSSEGVLYGVGNSLAVTGTSSPVAVGTGAAFVYGYFYENDSSLSVSIPTPTTSTRIDRIVLRVSWSAQTVRATRIAGTEGSGSAPAMTQTANTTWDIPLANVSITTGGVITVSDQRTFCKSPAVYGWFTHPLSLLSTLAVTGAITGSSSLQVASGVETTGGGAAFTSAGWQRGYTLPNGATVIWPKGASGSARAIGVTNNGDLYIMRSTANDASASATYDMTIADDTGNVTINNNLTVSGTLTPTALSGSGIVGATQLASNAVTTAKIADANVTTAKIATDAVDDTIVGNRVAKLYRRQGGSATDWSSAGTTTQTPGMIVEQVGVINKSFTSATLVSQTVTFPVAFSQTPLVTFSLGPTQGFYGGGNISYAHYESVSTTGFTVKISFTAANTGNLDITWRAIGTE